MTSNNTGNLDDGDCPTIIDDIEEPDIVGQQDEDSLNGFGSTTSIQADDEEEEEDDNEYYRNQAIAEANRKYDLRGSRRDDGAGNGKEYITQLHHLVMR